MKVNNQLENINSFNYHPLVKEALNYYLKYNNAKTLPYHNMNHMLCMMNVMKDYILEMFNNDDKMLDNADMDQVSIDDCMIAAIFHDFNHSGGKQTDTINIHNALLAFEDYVKTSNLINNENYILNKDAIIDMIKATEYPYVIKDDDLKTYQRIIRECDILAIMHTDILTQTIIGLSIEMCVKDLNVFIDEYYKFIKDSVNEFKSDTAKSFVDMYWNDFEDSISIVRKLLS